MGAARDFRFEYDKEYSKLFIKGHGSHSPFLKKENHGKLGWSTQDKAILNQTAKDLEELITEKKNQKIQQYLEELSPTQATEYSLWKATSKINKFWAKDDKVKAQIIQRFQNWTLRVIADAPWYVSDESLHRDLQIPCIREEVQYDSANTSKGWKHILIS